MNSLKTAALVAASLTASTAYGARPPTPVRVAQVEEASMTSRFYVPGTVRPAEDARLAAEISGKLQWVAEPGSEVAKGDVVARIDDTRLVPERKRQAAEVRRWEAQVKVRRQFLARQGQLEDRGVAVGVELDQARAELAMAEQNLAGARAALQRTREDVKRTRLRAPFDGQIVARLAQRGEFPREGSPVVQLVSIRRPEIWADASVTLAARLEQGVSLPVRVDGRVSPAKLSAIIQGGSAERRVVSLRLIPPSSAGLSLGAAVEVGLPGRRVERQTVVPRDALVLREEGAHVMVMDEKGAVHRVPVEVGLGEGDRVSVSGALKPGQAVVRIGAERLDDGDLVRVVEG